MSVIVWDGATYKAPRLLDTPQGALSVAVLKSDGVSAYFRRSDDGDTWDSAPVLIGSLSGSTIKQVEIRQRARIGKTQLQLVVTNGTDKMWTSDDAGRTWTAA